MMTTFAWKPMVFCDKCPRALIFDERDGVKILRHDSSSCERKDQIFLAPSLQLLRLE
jgi:hypothetical protein